MPNFRQRLMDTGSATWTGPCAKPEPADPVGREEDWADGGGASPAASRAYEPIRSRMAAGLAEAVVRNVYPAREHGGAENASPAYAFSDLGALAGTGCGRLNL